MEVHMGWSEKLRMLLEELRLARYSNCSDSQIQAKASISWATKVRWVSVRDCHQANLSLALEMLELK